MSEEKKAKASSFREIVTRTTVANLVAAFLIIAGMLYSIATNDAKGVSFMAGAGIGWLFKEIKDRI